MELGREGVISKVLLFTRFNTSNNIKKVCKSLFVSIVFILLSSQNCNVSATTNKNASVSLLSSVQGVNIVTLKVCKAANSSFVNLTNGVIEIPTLLTDPLRYEPTKYKIDTSKPMVSCPNGEKPVSHQKTSIKKADFEEVFEAGDRTASALFEILISQHVLSENGFLSVGNDETTNAAYYSPNEFCIAGVSGAGLEKTVTFRTCPFNKTRPVLNKCCPLGMAVTRGECIAVNNSEKWDPGYMDANTKKILPIDKVNPVYQFQFLTDEPLETWETDECEHLFHPATDNTIAAIGSSRIWEFFNFSNAWCIDAEVSGKEGHQFLVFASDKEHSKKNSDKNSKQRTESYFYMFSMYIGAFFHFLTTLVHLVTWKRQNIHGRTLCFCTTALLFMQFFYGTAHVMGLVNILKGSTLCVLNSIVLQYFFIAAFTWLLIVNFDLWRTFAVTRLEGGSNLKRFLMFSAIGWLFPFLVTLISISMDFGFKCDTSGVLVPQFGQHFCFITPRAQGPYLFYILAVLMVLVFALAIMTLVGVYKVKKDAVNLRSTKRAADQQNVFLYLKLSVVMGVTWAFEVISWLAVDRKDGNYWAWIIFDVYNSLSAILIFIIFVCKTATLKLLEQSVPALKGIADAFAKLESTFSSSNDTATTTCSAEQGKNEAGPTTSSGNNAVRYTKEKEKVTTESPDSVG